MALEKSPSFNPALALWLALARAPSIGPVAFLKISARFPDLNELFNLSNDELRKCGFKEAVVDYLLNPNWDAVKQDLQWAKQAGKYIITYTDKEYPRLLKEIPAAPPILYVQGNITALQTPQLAMVGTRHPSTVGAEITYEFAEHLAGKGLTITSGLALGIDGLSHSGALAGKGLTIAVLGSGLNNIYPARHKKLAEQIIEQGALVSEFPPNETARAENFPRRNRIISGLSLGVLIVEAALQSGSLITAKYALEQGREIFAVPGSIHNPLTKGCHALIKQGAKLVETSNDILEELSSSFPSLALAEKTNPRSPLDLAVLDIHYRKVIECIEFVATPIDVIIHHSDLPAETVSSMVLMLELQGYIRSVNGGYIRV